ncbi:GNAT family N-acetyltransferase [Actinoplanes sp. GCM10030250]|uniref:GNAT family N-acetyltransferase n=1 Tax=Actinoplanes sp. GCM10030250 TaxID=3273376 RepID=UPI003606BB85
MGKFTVSSASADDMRLIADWAADEGWHPGDGDENVFFATDPAGFLIGRLDEHPISSIAAIRYGTGHGFIGLYLTAPEYRGQGYGFQTWQAGMQRLAGRNIGLDGVVAQQDNYRRSGFRDAWTTTRYSGVLAGAKTAAGLEIVEAGEVPFGELAAYDRRFFPAERDAFLALWSAGPGRHGVAAIRDDRVAGFAVRRPAGDTDRVGPLFADDVGVAESLLAALSTDYEMPVLIDVPGSNPEAAKLVERLGLEPSFETARMYTGGTPEVDVSGIYGITSLELG